MKLTHIKKHASKHFEIWLLAHTSAQVAREVDEATLNETDTEKWVGMTEASKQTKRTQTLHRQLPNLWPARIISESFFSDAKHIITADKYQIDPNTRFSS